MGSGKLEIGSCAWLEENQDLPGVQGVYAEQIAECKRKKAEREAKKESDKQHGNMERDTPPASGPFRDGDRL